MHFAQSALAARESDRVLSSCPAGVKVLEDIAYVNRALSSIDAPLSDLHEAELDTLHLKALQMAKDAADKLTQAQEQAARAQIKRADISRQLAAARLERDSLVANQEQQKKVIATKLTNIKGMTDDIQRMEKVRA